MNQPAAIFQSFTLAKDLWAQADKISPWSGKFEIAYNADGGHQARVDAVANSLKNTLGIEASGKPYVDFASPRKDVNARTMKTAFRTGWQADYPSQYNFLQPLYGSKASSNDSDYANPAFDKLLADGASASDNATTIADYVKAQELLLNDLPSIPLWYSNVTGGFAEGVSNVTFGWNSVPLYYKITKALRPCGVQGGGGHYDRLHPATLRPRCRCARYPRGRRVIGD